VNACQEIHPAHVADLSFVTGGTCSSKDILEQERLILCVSWLFIIVCHSALVYLCVILHYFKYRSLQGLHACSEVAAFPEQMS